MEKLHVLYKLVKGLCTNKNEIVDLNGNMRNASVNSKTKPGESWANLIKASRYSRNFLGGVLNITKGHQDATPKADKLIMIFKKKKNKKAVLQSTPPLYHLDS